MTLDNLSDSSKYEGNWENLDIITGSTTVGNCNENVENEAEDMLPDSEETQDEITEEEKTLRYNVLPNRHAFHKSTATACRELLKEIRNLTFSV